MASLTLQVRQEDGPTLGRLIGDRQRAAIQRGVADGTLKRMPSRRQESAGR